MTNLRVCPDSPRINSVSLYDQFIFNLRSRLEPIFPAPPEVEAALKSPRGSPVIRELEKSSDPNLQEIVESVDDEFLAAAFSSIFQNLEDIVVDTHKKSREIEVELDPLVPLEAILADSLSLGIMKHYSSSCTALVNLFIKVKNMNFLS